jgi:membrane protease YdiL (CAAX protease family)
MSQPQSRRMSLFESVCNVLLGYWLAVGAQLVIFPFFDLPARLNDALAMGAVFTGISIARSYILRRAFEAVRVRGAAHG